jgi:hypothetical protein
MKIRRLTYSRHTLLEGRPTIQSGVDPPLVVVAGESIQLAMKIEAVPEENLVEILAVVRKNSVSAGRCPEIFMV